MLSLRTVSRQALEERVADRLMFFNDPVMRITMGGRAPQTKEIVGFDRDAPEDFEEVLEEGTYDGNMKLKYQETYKGVPIFGRTVVLEQNAFGYTHFADGEIVEGVASDVPTSDAQISKNQAMEIAVTQEGDDPGDVQFRQEDATLNIVEKDGRGHLAYVLSYIAENENGTSRPFYVIDAKTGAVLDTWQGLNDIAYKMSSVGGNTKVGKYEYGGKYPKLDVDKRGNTCYLQNSFVKVIHLRNQGRSSSIRDAYGVPCNEGARDAVNGAYSPASDALHFAKGVYDMYKKWYNDDTIQRSIGQLVMRVHYLRNYQNAFWDGRQMTFGDGASRLFPLVSLDVVGHEVSHGYTQRTSGLIYRAQSGGMNEAFSDMSGEAVEAFLRGSNDWKIGYDIIKGSGSMRYMNNPPLDRRSIGHARDYRNGMDVHYSSGVYNKAFYLLSSKPGWGIRKAFGVMIKANKMYWRPNSDFNSGVCGAMSAASDLGYNKCDVQSAFQSVGVCCNGRCNTPCTPPSPPTPQPPTQRPGTPATRGPTPPTRQPPQPGRCDITGTRIGTSTTISSMLRNRSKTWFFYIPANACNFHIETLGGSGDADLYARENNGGSSRWYSSKGSSSKEKIVFTSPKPGKYDIMVKAANNIRSVTLKVYYNMKS